MKHDVNMLYCSKGYLEFLVGVKTYKLCELFKLFQTKEGIKSIGLYIFFEKFKKDIKSIQIYSAKTACKCEGTSLKS
jgi:hypothetical protein